MLNEQKGNMYGWVTHTWNPIKGKCPHDCVYCYMKSFPQRELRLDTKEFRIDLGKNNFIFVGSSTDMWAEEVSTLWIRSVLEACKKYPKNTYLFQTKNPSRFFEFMEYMPPEIVLGTTLESNRDCGVSKAPHVSARRNNLSLVPNGFKTMVSIEPILDFDVLPFLHDIIAIHPSWVSIGADSKGHKMPEPSADKIMRLINLLKAEGIEVRIKPNLNRLTASLISNDGE